MIRFANVEDIKNIMNFIKNNWNEKHILANNLNFFEYQHKINECDKISYVISENNKHEIDAILGYIKYSNDISDVMTVMWMSVNNEDATLGLKLLMFLIKDLNLRITASPGINKKTVGIYKYLGYHTGIMKHWYRLSNKDKYNIAKVVEKNIPNSCNNKQITLIKLNNLTEFKELVDTSVYENKQAKPFKDIDYINKRYFEHPIYKYHVYGIDNGESKLKTIIVLRYEEINNSKAIRFIDCIGEFDKIENITTALDDLLVQENAEYIDIYNAGLDDDIFNNSGWIEVGTNENIIPNYFSPFVQENVDIRYFTSDNEIVLFKGDGDQDRPN